MTTGETMPIETLACADEIAGRFSLVPHPHPSSPSELEAALAELSFGTRFADYMAHAEWSREEGWRGHEVCAFADISLSPAAAILHYGQEVFEGLKAYRHDDGSIWMFRPAFNAARFNASARRMALPELPVNDFVASMVDVVRAAPEWVPSTPGSSLYLRPFMFASEAFLGVHAADRVSYYMIASPVGPYFSQGLAPVNIWVTRDYHRAGPGGTGAAKTAGNYAASLLPQREAAERGFDQVCFLDARTSTALEELGGMNVFVVDANGEVTTPALSGTILEGNTRSAVIRVLRDQGMVVREERIEIDRLVERITRGEVVEMFACGTAAVVTPIGRLASDDFDVTLERSDVTLGVYTALTNIQTGVADDPYGWMYRVM